MTQLHLVQNYTMHLNSPEWLKIDGQALSGLVKTLRLAEPVVG